MNARRAVRIALRWGPFAAALAATALLAGSAGGYTNSWQALRTVLDWLAPGHAPISDYGVTLYQLNDAARRAAHAIVAAAAVVLADRGPCAGLPLRGRLPASVGAGLLVAACAAVVRWRADDRHVRIEQWAPTLAGLALGAAWVGLAAATRRLALWAAEPERTEPETEAVSTP